MILDRARKYIRAALWRSVIVVVPTAMQAGRALFSRGLESPGAIKWKPVLPHDRLGAGATKFMFFPARSVRGYYEQALWNCSKSHPGIANAASTGTCRGRPVFPVHFGVT